VMEEEATEETDEAMDEEMAETMDAPGEVLDKVFYGDTWTWPYQPDMLAGMSRGRFFVPVQDEDKIAMIDPDVEGYALQFVSTDYVQPHHPWMAPGMRYNVINFQSEGKGDHDAMAVQDTQTGEIIKYINTGNNDPFHMAFSPTDNILVTADLDDNVGRVHIFDTETWEEIGQVETSGMRTRDITITHDGKYAFIGHNEYIPEDGNMGSVDVLDIYNQEIVGSFGEGRCRSGKMTNAGDMVFYSCDKSDQVVVIDTATLEEIKRIDAPEGSGPFNISFRPDDKFAYVGLSSAGQLGIIDVEQLEFVKTLDSGTNTNSTYIHPYAPLAVTTNDGSDTHVSIVDTENNEIIDQIEVGSKSSHNAQWSPDGRWMIVSNRGGDSLTLLAYNPETESIEWVDDIAVGFGANGVHWAPYFCGVEELTPENVGTVENLPMIDAAGTCGSLDDITSIPADSSGG
jgi:DNA-binding beta-propeller fold protein YncE